MKNEFPRLKTYRGHFNATAFFVLFGLFSLVIIAVIAAVWAVIRAWSWLQS